MDAFVNTSLLNPVNAIIVVLILLFGAYGAFAIYSNAGTLTPKL
jgi:hypothetical protein